MDKLLLLLIIACWAVYCLSQNQPKSFTKQTQTDPILPSANLDNTALEQTLDHLLTSMKNLNQTL